MTNSWKIVALIAAVILMVSHPLSALPPASAPATSGAVSVARLPQSPLEPSALTAASKLLVQLDGQDGARVTYGDTWAAFSGLRAGLHGARLILLDEHNRPLQAAFAIVAFRTHATTVPPPGSLQTLPDDAGAAAPGPPPIPPELRNEGDPSLPATNRDPLLLVSLIGFALLIGGIIPGMRMRRVHTPHTAQL